MKIEQHLKALQAAFYPTKTLCRVSATKAEQDWFTEGCSRCDGRCQRLPHHRVRGRSVAFADHGRRERVDPVSTDAGRARRRWRRRPGEPEPSGRPVGQTAGLEDARPAAGASSLSQAPAGSVGGVRGGPLRFWQRFETTFQACSFRSSLYALLLLKINVLFPPQHEMSPPTVPI